MAAVVEWRVAGAKAYWGVTNDDPPTGWAEQKIKTVQNESEARDETHIPASGGGPAAVPDGDRLHGPVNQAGDCQATRSPTPTSRRSLRAP